MHQIDQLITFFVGILLGIIGFMFDVPPATLWTAAFGACMGLALKPPMSVKIGILIIIGSAFSVGLMVPFFVSNPPTNPEKSISFVIALISVAGRNLLPQLAQDILTAFGDRIIELIKGWRPK